MKWFFAGLILLLLLCALCYRPAAGVTPETLVPERTLCVYCEEGKIVLAGAQSLGSGADFDAAWQDLQDSTPGTVFFETVERVAVQRQAAACLPALRSTQALRPGVQLYLLQGSVTPALYEFLAVRKDGLARWKAGPPPQIIEEEAGRYKLA